MLSLLFLLGLCVGSFLNVVALRYDGEHFVFNPKIIGGRSRCPSCGKTLRWYELVPLLSFIVQRAACRNCGAKIGWRYPAIELLSGFIFVAVPWQLSQGQGASSQGIEILWIVSFLILLLISYIDIRLGVIPDELEVLLGVCAIGIVLLQPACALRLAPCNLSSHIIGAVVGFAFFELLVLVTRGKGMGMGDVKFALPLGFLFGWPDILPVVGSAFVFGALVGTAGIVLKKKTMGATLPFGPFLALGAAFVFFLGLPVAQWYFRMVGI